MVSMIKTETRDCEKEELKDSRSTCKTALVARRFEEQSRDNVNELPVEQKY